MSSERQAAPTPAVTVRDLVEEGKKRIVFLIVCLVGLSYLMSLTSSSVLVNLPAAAVLIIIFRYLSLDFDMRRKAAIYKSKPSPVYIASQKKPSECPRVIIEKSDWRHKVNSPIVEDAIDQFTRHLVSEWVTDLWYSRITPDKQGPEELVQIMNGVLGEISCRMRNINLIDLLTRDIINLLCSHLEFFRATNAKIEKQHSRSLTMEERDKELKSVLSAENKLHPSLFSIEAEHKVLQHIMDGLMSFTFKPEDLHCSLFHYIVRELLACAVMRPVLNLASPRFINERIESLVISLSKTEKVATAAEVGSQPKSNGSIKVSSDHFSRFLDPSAKGVELVQLKKDHSTASGEKHDMDNINKNDILKDPLLSMDARSTRSWSALPSDSQTGEGKGIQQHRSGGEWGEMLDVLSRRKTEALAPEHFENMWAKGRNYKRKEATTQSADQIPQGSVNRSTEFSKQKQDGERKVSGFSKQTVANESSSQNEWQNQNCFSHRKEDEHEIIQSDEVETVSSSSYTTEDEENSAATGLDTPSVRIWDANNKKNVSNIHHPLEVFDGRKTRKPRKKNHHSQRLTKAMSARKRSRSVSEKAHVWQEVERTSFLLGDGLDILNCSTAMVKPEDSSDDSGADMFGRISSGSTASSFLSSTSLPENYNPTANPSKNSIIADSFLTLRCEVLGANIVKSGSKTFAVYSISVTDMNSHSWSIKRRFRHFEELHRRLKEFPEYNLHLPPKHFLSTGLDVPIIQERCKSLDKYLKNLMQLPTVSNSIEVWDFLSVDSQTYIFSNPLSIIETLSVNLVHTAHERSKEYQSNVGFVKDPASSKREHVNVEKKEQALRMKHSSMPEGSQMNTKSVALSSPKKPVILVRKSLEDSSSDSDSTMPRGLISNKNLDKTSNTGKEGLHSSSKLPIDAASDPTLPSEWVPPNLSLPILDLVDVIFQLQDGGWIRRKAFWVAKQVLQLGMGDAFDDWLIEKIQLLRRGSVVAAGFRRLEQILWPDGIFLTKHPKRRKPTLSASPSQNSSHGQPPTPLSSPKIENVQMVDDTQQREAERRAKLVYDLMINKAPAAVVGLVGHKEYEQCAKDLYYFIQSSVVMKQLAFDLLELLLLSAFPELDYLFKELHEEKEKFGELEVD
ncbi:hypothetical protein ACH5RR_024507 [Cinchona calisaya]|uniref:Uncharacterized protein n=1 Tax=Cinchona calisaya TaxID=153742 RepID=A0ABD2YWV5_9GENT